VNTIRRLLVSLERDALVKDVQIGVFWTAVALDDERCGLASTIAERDCAGGSAMPDAGELAGMSGRDLAGWLLAGSSLQASVGMAACNALLDVPQERCRELNAEELVVERGAGRKVAIVGHFPFVERVQREAETCWVLEQNPRAGDLPARRALDVLPAADVIAITGTTLINGTFEELIGLCRPESYVLVLGPSTPLTPVLFDAGVDAVSGTLVVDPERVVRSARQGASFRQIKRNGGVRLLTMER
jgi:hypothetical protein